VTGLQVAATLLLNAYFHLSLQRMRVHYSVAFPFLRTWEPQILAQFGAHVHPTHDASNNQNGIDQARAAGEPGARAWPGFDGHCEIEPA